MKAKNKSLRIVLIAGAVVLVTVAAIGAAVFVYFRSLDGSTAAERRITSRRAQKPQIDAVLAEADYDISLGYYDKALEELEKVSTRSRGEYNHLRILKRVYRISYDLGDYSILAAIAKSALERIPGSNKLARISAYASIRAGTGTRIAKKMPYLQAEAYLTGFADALPAVEQDLELKKILSLLEQPETAEGNAAPRDAVPRNAAPPDPFLLQRLGSDLDEPRIHLDAALLWMAQGDAESAYTLMSRHLEDPLFREAGIYIAYDAGHEQAALSLLQGQTEQNISSRRVDLRIMEADLTLLLDNPEAASHLYQQIVDTHPDYSWTPYLNLARITGRREYLERAYAYFPEVGSVAVSYARSLSEYGNHKQASEILESYIDENEEDFQAQLLLLEVQNTASSPAVYQGALWKLFNSHPDSRMLCEHLFLYLLEFNDLSGAASVLRHYELATGRIQEPWFLDLRAILSVAGREDAEAIRLLRQRLALEDSWQARFNLGVLLGYAHQPRQAIEQFIESENLLPADRRNHNQSRIRSHIGEQYLYLGDAAAARRECEYAVDLDLSNFHAHSILRILERE